MGYEKALRLGGATRYRGGVCQVKVAVRVGATDLSLQILRAFGDSVRNGLGGCGIWIFCGR
jgi:hypothetical protein